MKDRLAIPFLGPEPADLPDVPGWVHRHGWRVTLFEIRGAMRLGGEMQLLRVTLAPQAPRDPRATAEITVTSGATLVYDERDRAMAVSFEPEPQDAVPTQTKGFGPNDAWPLCCPSCGRAWLELPKYHTYTSRGLCFDVPLQDAVPSEPGNAAAQSFVKKHTDMSLLQDAKPLRLLPFTRRRR